MKTRIVALLLAWFFGVMGFHNFYLNENKAGTTKLIIFFVSIPLSFIAIGLVGFAALAVCALLDFVKIATMTNEEFNKLYNK